VTLVTGFDLCRAAVAVVDISAPEQSVLMVLAIMADKQAQCWPSVAGLVSRTKLSERAVQNAVKALAAKGHLTRLERPGRGVIYTLHPRSAGEAAECISPAPPAPRTSCTPQEMRPAGDAPSPAPPAPKQPRTTIPTKASPSSGKRERSPAMETFLPAGFAPEVRPGSITAKAMDAWPPGTLEEQLEHFTDHHTVKRTKSADWQASWRTWVKNWKSFNGNRQRNRPHHHDRSEPQNPMVRAVQRSEARAAGRDGAGVQPHLLT
jgi:DNA-binding MarR family transcriptional regulator